MSELKKKKGLIHALTSPLFSSWLVAVFEELLTLSSSRFADEFHAYFSTRDLRAIVSVSRCNNVEGMLETAAGAGVI